MKPLHTSSQVTASDSRMVVRVMEISTPDGPVRRIVVEVNAEMDTTEARWLRDELDLAITLAEGEDQPEAEVCGVRPGGVHCLHYQEGDGECCGCGQQPCLCPDVPKDECPRHAAQPDKQPAVSEDQPKPRVFPKGSPEPEGVEAVTDEAGFRWNRAGRVNDRQHHWRRVDLGVMGSFVLWTRLNRRPLSEVLADSEQVTCNGSGLVEDGDAPTSEFNFRGPHDTIGEPPPKPCPGCVNCAKTVRHG